MKVVKTHNFSEDQIIFFKDYSLPFKIQAISENFAICTRPLDEKEDADIISKPFKSYSKSVVVYTIIDFQNNWRAPDDYLFSPYNYQKKRDCKKALRSLSKGIFNLSRRNGVVLDIDYDRTNVKA